MIARIAAVAAVLLLALQTPAQADVGEPAIAVITRLQSSEQFKNVGTDHGTVAGENMQRWKFETASNERIAFTVDAKNANAPVERETYVRFTDMDPYSLRPGQSTGRTDLGDVLSPRELLDFSHAAALVTIEEKPLHLVAFFYRGRFAAYEVLEPKPRHPDLQNRYEWRSFNLSELDAVMKAARSCNNGPDCAAWY